MPRPIRDPGYSYSDGRDMYGTCQYCHSQHKHRYWCDYAPTDTLRKEEKLVVKVYSIDSKTRAMKIMGDVKSIKQRILERQNAMISEKGKLEPEKEDIFVIRKKLFPLWAFADINEGKYCTYPYWCFVGMHYPPGLVSEDETKYKVALELINNGNYTAEQKKIHPERKMGWGNGKNPGEAFRLALRMAGYFERAGGTKLEGSGS